MFHSIPEPIQERMRELETIDARDRTDGTPRLQRLRQIPPETGKFLALLAANSPPGDLLEIGASAGYSSLWLALACRERRSRLITFEVLPEKANLAQQTFQAAQVQDVVQLVVGDALHYLGDYERTAFCFLDSEKEVYRQCYETVIPNLVKGGLFVADNVISHQEELQPFVDRALSDERVDGVVVPVGKGLLVCRKI